MKLIDRIMWAVIILAVDGLFFFLPLMALAAAYVLIARPKGFRNLVDRIYSEA